MKKTKTTELGIQEVTLRNLDEPMLDAMAGGYPIHTSLTCGATCPVKTCATSDNC